MFWYNYEGGCRSINPARPQLGSFLLFEDNLRTIRCVQDVWDSREQKKTRCPKPVLDQQPTCLGVVAIHFSDVSHLGVEGPEAGQSAADWGKIFLVVGECGDGKSTLINALRAPSRTDRVAAFRRGRPEAEAETSRIYAARD